ncbi:hypothetical protein BGX20_005851, partial [Mortierella sp. AD010]
MSQDIGGSNAKNFDLHRPHDGENGGDEPLQKRQIVAINHPQGQDMEGAIPATPGMRVVVPDSQTKPVESSDPNSALFRAIQGQPGQGGWRHNKQLGFKKTQELLNKDKDQDGDMMMTEERTTDGTVESGEDDRSSQEDKEEQWTVVAHQRERTLAVRVAHSDLRGDNVKERLQDLKDMLLGLRVNPTTTPTTMRVDGVPYFRVAVATQKEMDTLLEGVVDDSLHEGSDMSQEMEESDGLVGPQQSTPRPFFLRIDLTAERQHDLARSMELYGLPARINMDLINYAANQLGTVEKIELRGCSRGKKMIAIITFEDADDVIALQENMVRDVTVGTDIIRIRRLGEQALEWNLEKVYKLHGLPYGTTPYELRSVLESLMLKVDFVEIPRYYVNNGTQFRYIKEAFVYFRTDEDAVQAMTKNIKIGYNQLKWLDPRDKRCYTCNEHMHAGRCPKLLKRREDRAHQRSVMAFHRASGSKVDVGTSFAELLKGKGRRNPEQQQAKANQGTSVTEEQKETKGQRNTHKGNPTTNQAPPATEEHYPSLTGTTQQRETTRARNDHQTKTSGFDAIMAEMAERQRALEES